MSTLTYWWSSASLDYYTTYQENLQKVTRADIQAYVKNYIKGKYYVDGLLMSSSLKENTGIKSFEDIR